MDEPVAEVAVYCDKCHVYMIRDVKGITVPHTHNNEIRIGNRFTCPSCGNGVVSDFGIPTTADIQHFKVLAEATAI